jgi:hypothetical protein
MSIEAVNIQQQVLHLISQIQCEDIRRMRENREVSRQNISLPVTARFVNGAGELDAVSRDISSAGIGLITATEIAPQTTAELEIQLTSSTTAIFGECHWCVNYGKSFYLTGWKFIGPADAAF